MGKTTFKVCPKCRGDNFVASKRCRHAPCDHVFLTGPRGEKAAANRARSRVRKNPTAAAALGSAPFPSSASSSSPSLPLPVSRPRGRARRSTPPPPPPLPLSSVSSSTDLNQDTCAICHDTGKLLCCDDCELAYHLDCASLLKVPRGHWACPRCQGEKAKAKRESEKAANGGGGEASVGGGGGMGGVEGLDVSQQALWAALETDKGEDIEVDGLTFTCFPAPPPAAAPQLKKEEGLEEQKEAADDSSSRMQDDGAAG